MKLNKKPIAVGIVGGLAIISLAYLFRIKGDAIWFAITDTKAVRATKYAIEEKQNEAKEDVIDKLTGEFMLSPIVQKNDL